MPDSAGPASITQRLADQASAINTLAAQRAAFDAAVDAYLKADANGFRKALEEQRLLDKCELVCDWIRVKWCTITCLRVCGPPSVDAKEPADIRRLAEVVEKIASNEGLLNAVIESVQTQESATFGGVVKQLAFQDICHYVCSWFCTILSERLCRIVCSSEPVAVPSPVETVRSAAAVIAALAADGRTLETAATAARALDCDGLRKVIVGAGQQDGCHIICEWFCTWRCVFVCLSLCRVAPPNVTNVRDELYAFAQAVGRLAPDAITALAAAVQTVNVDQFTAEIERLKYQAYCIQLCRWICFGVCEEFCICVCPPVSIAVFTKIGGYYYEFDVASALGGSGLTNDNRAFFNTMRLNGGYSLVDGAPQIQYRFETVPTDASGTPTGTWTGVLPTQIAQTNIGSFILPFFPFFQEVWVNGPSGLHDFNITPDADGWITVPGMHPSPAVTFVPGSDLINLVSQTLRTWTPSNESATVAGSSANTPLIQDQYYGIRMRMRNVGDTTDGSDAGTCVHVAIDDTVYDQVHHHQYWDGWVSGVTPYLDELAVCSLGIQELISDGCGELTNSMTPVFTAAHPNLDPNGVSITLIGPGGPYAFTLNPAAPGTPGNWFGNATPAGPWTVANLEDCAYIVQLSVSVLLTTGDSDPSPLIDQIAFCKQG